MKGMELEGVCCSGECGQQLTELAGKIDGYLVRLSKLRRELMSGNCSDATELAAIITEGRPVTEQCMTMMRVADGLLKADSTTMGPSSSKASSKKGSAKGSVKKVKQGKK